MVGQYIRDSKLINSTFDCHYINLTTAESLQDIGKVSLKKLWRFLMLLVEIFRYVRQVKPQLWGTTTTRELHEDSTDGLTISCIEASLTA